MRMRRRTGDVAARPRQLELFYTGPPSKRRFPSGEKWGRPEKEGAGPRHVARPGLDPRHPVHVTLEVRAGLPSLRRAREFRVVRRAIVAGLGRFGTRLVAWSVQTNHVHLLVEVDGRELLREERPGIEGSKLDALDAEEVAKLTRRALSKARKGFGVRTASALNALWGRRGDVWKERYHTVVITGPKQMWYALRYVLTNGQKHGACHEQIDPCSSAPYFQHWEAPIPPPTEPREEWPVDEPRTWIGAVGWKRYGPIPFPKIAGRAAPAPRRPRTPARALLPT